MDIRFCYANLWLNHNNAIFLQRMRASIDLYEALNKSFGLQNLQISAKFYNYSWRAKCKFESLNDFTHTHTHTHTHTRNLQNVRRSWILGAADYMLFTVRSKLAWKNPNRRLCPSWELYIIYSKIHHEELSTWRA